MKNKYGEEYKAILNLLQNVENCSQSIVSRLEKKFVHIQIDMVMCIIMVITSAMGRIPKKVAGKIS